MQYKTNPKPKRPVEIQNEESELILKTLVTNSPRRLSTAELYEEVATTISNPDLVDRTTLSVKVSHAWRNAQGIWAHVYREVDENTKGGVKYVYWFDQNQPARQPILGETRWTEKRAIKVLNELFMSHPSETLTAEQIKHLIGYEFSLQMLRRYLNQGIEKEHLYAVKLAGRHGVYKSTVPRPLADTGTRRRPMKELAQELAPVAGICEHRSQYVNADGKFWCPDCGVIVTGPAEVDHQQELPLITESPLVDDDGWRYDPTVRQYVAPVADTVVVQEERKVAEPRMDLEVFLNTYYETVGRTKAGDVVLRAPDGTLGTFLAI